MQSKFRQTKRRRNGIISEGIFLNFPSLFSSHFGTSAYFSSWLILFLIKSKSFELNSILINSDVSLNVDVFLPVWHFPLCLQQFLQYLQNLHFLNLWVGVFKPIISSINFNKASTSSFSFIIFPLIFSTFKYLEFFFCLLLIDLSCCNSILNSESLIWDTELSSSSPRM